MKDDFNFEEIEKKWQRIWAEEEVFEVGEDPSRPKYYLLEMYPYPSGRIHMGHVRNYSIGDVIARFKAMKGFNVIHPIGWDALGMPAENAAIKHGIHPRTWTLDNIANMREPAQEDGLRLRLVPRGQLLPARLLQVEPVDLPEDVRARPGLPQGQLGQLVPPVPDRPGQRTGRRRGLLAVRHAGHAEEDGAVVPQDHRLRRGASLRPRGARQVARARPPDAEELDRQEHGRPRSTSRSPRSARPSRSSRPGSIRSTGPRSSSSRPSTPWRATSSPPRPRRAEHEAWIAKAVAAARTRREIGDDEKEGIDTGAKAVNPFTGELIPVWIANYVLMDYGTGAIMAVPAHDQRDYDFADEVRASHPDRHRPRAGRRTRPPRRGRPSSGSASSRTRARSPACAAPRPWTRWAPTPRRRASAAGARPSASATGASPASGTGERPSRSSTARSAASVGVPYEDLPVEIPYDVAITGEEGSPLERAESFVNTTCPKCGGKARRETDTMDTFVDSSWYFFRYTSPHEETLPFRPGSREVLAPGRPLHRRRRARHPPPHLRPVLHQGPPGPRTDRYQRAVSPLPGPGHGHQGRLGHVQVQGEHRRPRRDPQEVRRRRPAAVHPLRLASREGIRLGGGGARGVPPVPAPRLDGGPREPGPLRGAGPGPGGRRPGRGPSPERPTRPSARSPRTSGSASI